MFAKLVETNLCVTMLRAIFLLAFHALLRLGEIVAKSYADYGKIL
jgi:hypothetical protein